MEFRKYYVSYRTAQLASALDFNDDCLTTYDRNGNLIPEWYVDTSDINDETGEGYWCNKNSIADDVILAPLKVQLQDWLREKYNIHIVVYFFSGKYEVSIFDEDEYLSEDDISILRDNVFSDYHIAFEEALKVVLKFIMIQHGYNADPYYGEDLKESRISFITAGKANKLVGFDLQTDKVYNEEGVLLDVVASNLDLIHSYSAPTQEQLRKWLLENTVFVNISYQSKLTANANRQGFYSVINKIPSGDFFSQRKTGVYKFFEDAFEAGLLQGIYMLYELNNSKK